MARNFRKAAVRTLQKFEKANDQLDGGRQLLRVGIRAPTAEGCIVEGYVEVEQSVVRRADVLRGNGVYVTKKRSNVVHEKWVLTRREVVPFIPLN